MNTVPSIFIGSSSETLEAAGALQTQLAKHFAVKLWTGAFRAGEMLLPAIVSLVGNHDFGIFLFGPDDDLKSRGRNFKSVRDNVVLELGIFMGGLGPARTFVAVVKPNRKAHRLQIPSDLAGYLRAGDITRTKQGWNVSAVATAVTHAARELGPALRNSHNEILTMITNLDDQEIVAKGRKYLLGALVRAAAIARPRPWLARNQPMELMAHIRKATDSRKATDEAYWWLVVEGVFKFRDIEQFAGDSWDWDESIEFVQLSERGIALLNELRTGRHERTKARTAAAIKTRIR